MTRTILTLLTALAVSALLTVPAMAQATPPVAPKAGTTGVQATAAKDQIEYLKEVQDLHSRIRAAQWDLWSLQQQNADQKKVAAKTKELTRLRTRLHELNVANRPAVGFGPGWGFGRGRYAWGAGPGWGFGRGPCVWGAGPASGFGRGPGVWGTGPGYGRQYGWGGGARGWRGGWRGGPGPFCPYRAF